MSHLSAQSGVHMNLFAAFAGVCCLVLATSASAAGDRACREDAAKLCKGVKPGGGAIVKCLKEHSSEVSPACKADMEKAKEKSKEFRQACKEDKAKLCHDVKPGGGAVLKCLREHESDLSASCRQEMSERKRKI